ncbi:MAG: DAK2 domain-containing protein [Eubacteriales bacterium]
MNIARLDGLLFARMLQNGLNNLRNREDEINKLNVFPVADGDTGTNMRMTLENGIKYAGRNAEIGKYLCALSDGMLLGARGNSGVILSQIFKGIYEELSRASTINAGDLRNGFIRGYRTAYNTVVRPVEGTILTVSREGIENIRRQIGRGTSIETMLSMYVAEMKKTLSYTPEILAVLKSAGVVDSGAMGYITIVEGMLKYLYGEKISAKKRESASASETVSSVSSVNLDCFNERSVFVEGYCMEFLLQLMTQPGYLQNFNLNEFIETLTLFGNSLVAIRDGMRVKVHIHTKKPDKIIAFCRQYGEFLTFKLDNMQLQHNEHEKKLETKKDKVPLAIIAVADGDSFRELFLSFGCAVVLNGGAMMNTSSAEFLDAMNSVCAERIVVLPNNSNSIGAAAQAKALYKGDSNVTVLESKSMVEAYYALAMDVSDSSDLDYRISQMKNGISGTHTLAVASASKEYAANDLTVKIGDEIAMLDSEIIASSENWTDTVIEGIKALSAADDKEICVIFRGCDMSEENETELESAISDAFPDLEVNFIYGGQHIYHWLIGLI